MDGVGAGWPAGHCRMGAGSRVTVARSGAQYTTTPRQVTDRRHPLAVYPPLD
jgi:hypothetical protein